MVGINFTFVVKFLYCLTEFYKEHEFFLSLPKDIFSLLLEREEGEKRGKR